LESDEPKIGGWLRTVVRCKAADHQRKQIRARNAVAASEAAAPSGRAAAQPSEPLEAEENRKHVLRILDELSDRQRTVLEWKYLESLGVREIAERLGESEKAVESVLYRARREFRRLFEVAAQCRPAMPVLDAALANDVPMNSSDDADRLAGPASEPR
jgi:RNA polymerase sigma factor (sigma-70 family)